MKVADFDFYLPDDLIAKKPVEKRDASRLIVLHRDGKIEHKTFRDLPSYLNSGDMLLLNDTKVFPASIRGIKTRGGELAILLIREIEKDTWEILSKGRYTGSITISENFSAEIKEGRTAQFKYKGSFIDMLWKYGDMPLPPYIKRKPEFMDKERYQTVYAEDEGSIAAPTAGLHFTDRLIKEIADKGVKVRYITLHVGIGTFKPIRADDVEEHLMDPEYFKISRDVIKDIDNVRKSGNKVVSVGTTTTRAIEGYLSDQFSVVGCQDNGRVCGTTDIFIYPGYEFKAVDSLVTNFHLPRSTPLMLASAFCGIEKLKNAYGTAVSGRYRFFSYGDAMLIL